MRKRFVNSDVLKNSAIAVLPSAIVLIVITLIATIADGFEWNKLGLAFQRLVPLYIAILGALFLMFYSIIRFREKAFLIILLFTGSLLLLSSIKDSMIETYVSTYIRSVVDLDMFAIGLAILTYAISLSQMSTNRKSSIGFLKEGTMLYLFNSSYESLYQQNLLKTLFLPYGSTNEYRYSYKTSQKNISAELIDKLPKLKGHNVIISYIDRRGIDGQGHPAYKYYPIRKGILEKSSQDNDRVIFRVRLLDFIHPVDKQDFSDKMKNSLPHIPVLTHNDWKEKDDGHYAIESDDILGDSEFNEGELAWIKCQDTVARTPAYTNSDTRQFIFVRSELYTCKDDKAVRAKLGPDKNYYIPTVKGETYSLHISYAYPYRETHNQPTPYMKFETSNNISPVSEISMPLDSHSNRVEFKFEVKSDSPEKYAAVKFSIPSLEGIVEIIAPEVNLVFHIKESWQFWTHALVALLVFTISGTIVAGNNTLSFTPKLALIVLQAVSIFWLWFKTGRKIL